MTNLNSIYRVNINHEPYAVTMVQDLYDHVRFCLKNEQGQAFDLDVYEDNEPKKILSWEVEKGVAFSRVHEVGFDVF